MTWLGCANNGDWRKREEEENSRQGFNIASQLAGLSTHPVSEIICFFPAAAQRTEASSFQVRISWHTVRCECQERINQKPITSPQIDVKSLSDKFDLL